MTRVSIVSPSLNQSAYIESTIESVAEQRGVEIEHIVMDGGSTDGTVERLRKLSSRYEFEWISKPDNGQADAINKGFQRSEGEILGWLNCDDIYLRDDAVATAVSYFDTYPRADIVTGSGIVIDESGRWERPINPKPEKMARKHLRYYDPVLQPATFWRRGVWERFALDQALHFTFDWDFFFRASECYNILPIGETIAGYRRYGENKTDSGSHSRVREICSQTERHLGILSWQFMVLSGLRWLHAPSAQFNGDIADGWSRAVQRLSGLIHRLTFRRIQPL